MSDTRVIKKYPNRRLYDTAESRYITLSDIRQLVVDGERLKVIDNKSGEDITRSILLHVIAEQEENGASVMSEDFLARIIRSYSDKAQWLALQKQLVKAFQPPSEEAGIQATDQPDSGKIGETLKAKP